MLVSSAVRRAVRDRELGPPHPGGEPHRSAQSVDTGPGQSHLYRHALVLRNGV